MAENGAWRKTVPGTIPDRAPTCMLRADRRFTRAATLIVLGTICRCTICRDTWEDDALKLDPDTEEELGKRCLAELDRITRLRFGESILPYVDRSRPVIVRWSRQPFARGCSKLYRAATDVDNLCMLSHNQDFGKDSGLYFAGEGYSVEGGWAEPAMRGALDAVLWIIDAEGAKLEPKLNLELERDYPRWRKHEHPK